MPRLYAVINGKPIEINGEGIECIPVVRCKNCIHKVTTADGEYNPDDIVCDYWSTDGLMENDFCSYGERRDENATD